MQTVHSRIPIIKLWSILLVTLHGEVTDEFARNLSSDVLARIHKEGASGLVIDITGLWILDSHLCSMLAELASAALLMGARTLISGMNPDMAITLETMGVRLGEVVTTLDLESALHTLGVRVVDQEDGGADVGGGDADAPPLTDRDVRAPVSGPRPWPAGGW
jgi:rsbT antagonist protein RsbS